MASRLLLKGDQIQSPTTDETASTFSNATLVRLINVHASSAVLVTLVEAPGASATVVGSFQMLAQTEIYLEKKPTEGIFAANGNVKGVQVGLTN